MKFAGGHDPGPLALEPPAQQAQVEEQSAPEGPWSEPQQQQRQQQGPWGPEQTPGAPGPGGPWGPRQS